jgi:hypothetical protein
VNSVVRAFTALIAVMVAVLTPGVAMADEPVWHRAACFSGGIDSIEVKEEFQTHLTLTGHLDCGTRDKDARFGYARYDSSGLGAMTPDDLRRYRTGSLTPFAEGRYVEFGPIDFMICVVTDYDVPVACVQLVRDDWGSPLRVAPPELKDDATYGREVTLVDEFPVRPACGGCW